MFATIRWQIILNCSLWWKRLALPFSRDKQSITVHAQRHLQPGSTLSQSGGPSQLQRMSQAGKVAFHRLGLPGWTTQTTGFWWEMTGWLYMRRRLTDQRLGLGFVLIRNCQQCVARLAASSSFSITTITLWSVEMLHICQKVLRMSSNTDILLKILTIFSVRGAELLTLMMWVWGTQKT